MMAVCWRFRASFTLDVTSAEINQHWCSGILTYNPGRRRAILEANGFLIDEANDLPATGLFQGGQLSLDKSIVRVESNVLQDIESAMIHGKEACPPSSSSIQHDILWTTDRSKKTKRWMDGWMEYRPLERLAVFHDDEGRVLHRKRYSDKEEIPTEGATLNTSRYLIEISIACDSARKKKPSNQTRKTAIDDNEDGRDDDRHEEQEQEQFESTCHDLQNNLTYDVLYTTDKIRKAKRWKDGRLKWNRIKKQGIFFDEEAKTIHKRRMIEKELVEGMEIATAQYIFQICALQTICDTESIRIDDPKDDSRADAPLKPRSLSSKAVSRSALSPQSHGTATAKKRHMEAEQGRTNSDLLKLFKRRPAN